MDFDLAIIGAGPGGYVSAIRASQLGIKTIIFEKDKPGGVCLNIGCIPSKSLISQAEKYRNMLEFIDKGVKMDLTSFDYKKVFHESRKASETLSNGVKYLLEKNNITYINSQAKITDKNTIKYENKSITAKNIIIATGSRPRELKGFEFDEEKILSSTGILMQEKLPKSILIIGSGAIGMEFAYVMKSFGVDVTIAEMLDNILPLEDEDTAKILKDAFKKDGIKILNSTIAKSYENYEDLLKVKLENIKDNSISEIKVEKILVAVGRIPIIDDLGLENTKIKIEKGFIKVNDYYQTDESNIYAIGDVVKTPQLAHVASKEGEIAVEHIKGQKNKLNLNAIPSAVYCEPEIASFGYTEKALKENDKKYEKAYFPYYGAGKTVAIGKSDGIIKILYEPQTHEILGAHIAGYNATEIIHEILLAKSSELLPEDIANMIHAHPTISEAVMESMRAVEGWAIHI